MNREESGLRDHLRELRCRYAVERALSGLDRDWDTSLRQVVEALPSGFRSPERVAARLRLGDRSYATPGFRSAERSLVVPLVVGEEREGELEVAVSPERPAGEVVPILPKERKLLHTIAARVGEAWRIRRKWDQLRLQEMALQSAANSVVITDHEGKIRWVNGAFTEVTGYSRDEALARDPGDLLRSGEQDDAFYADLWRTISKGEVWRGRIINRRKDGTCYPEDQTITPVLDPSGRITHFIAVKVDLTERDELEAQLRQAHKMEAFGRLASGVAHDFNNLLTVVRGHAEIMLGDVAPDSTLSEDLRQVLQEVERGGGLARQLLAFSRKKVLDKEILDLGAVVASLRPVLRRLLPERVELRFHLGDEVRGIWADSGQLHQVLLNLALNAADAIAGTGTITFQVDAREVTAQDSREIPWKVEPGVYAELRVADTGVGIPADIRGRIFDPFFTTKPEGQGTGLGLSMVFKIVKETGGHVFVESQPDEGTTFRILFPSLEEVDERAKDDAGSVPAPEIQMRATRSSRGGETVLLAEDDPAVRRVACRVLERAGYRVLLAADGRKALRITREHRHEINLIVSDIVLPGMGGSELVDRIWRVIPGLPIVLMSGYSEEEVSERVRNKATAFLEKPFSPEELVRTVRETLQRPHRDGA